MLRIFETMGADIRTLPHPTVPRDGTTTINLTKTNTHENTKYLLLKGKASNIKKELKDIDKNMFRYEIINQDTTKERNIVLLCKDE